MLLRFNTAAAFFNAKRDMDKSFLSYSILFHVELYNKLLFQKIK